MSVCRSPSSSNFDDFFDELTISSSKSVNKFDNLIIVGDINLNITKKVAQNLINWKSYVIRLISQTKSETCYTNNHKSTIDQCFKNKPLSFQGTSTTETGLSDCHKLIFFEIIKNLMRVSSYLI